jgi:hypothetical protein
MKLLGGLALIVTLVLVGAVVALVLWVIPAIRVTPFAATIDIGAVLEAAAGIIGALATLLVAYLIGYLYSASATKKKADGDLLLRVLDDVRTALLSLQECTIPCHCGSKLTTAQRSKIVMTERELSQAVYSFSEAIGYCGATADATLSLQQLKDARVELKDSLTDSPFPGPYNEHARQRISKAFRLFRDEMNRLSFAIIRR